MTASGVVSVTVKLAIPVVASVVVVAVATPATAIAEWPDPWDSVTCLPPATGTPFVSFSVTVTLELSTPSAVAAAGLATTVEFVGETDVAANGEPSPGFSPASSQLGAT